MTDTPVAGGKIKAATTPAPYVVSAACSVNLPTASATAADIVGATVTVTTAQPNAVAMVTGIFDMVCTSTGGNGVGTCVVNGATQTRQAIHDLATAAARGSVAQVWTVPMATPGSYTIKLQGLSSAGGGVTFNSTHTALTALVLDW